MSQQPKTSIRAVVGYLKWRLNGRPISSTAHAVALDEWRDVFGSLVPRDRPSRDTFTCVLLCSEFSARDTKRTIEMQLAQTSDMWRMTIAARASDVVAATEVIRAVAPDDPRLVICVWDGEDDASVADTIDSLIAGETGSHVLLLEHGAGLTPTAVEWFRSCCGEADLVYSDEVVSSGGDPAPVFKPGWSPTLASVRNYVGSALAVRRTTLVGAGGYGRGLHDLTMRLAEGDISVCHLPNLLVERFDGAAVPCDDEALTTAAYRRGGDADIVARSDGSCAIEWSGTTSLSVKVVIPTRDHVEHLRRSVESVLRARDVANLSLVIVDNGSRDPETLDYLDRLVELDDRVSIVRDGGSFNFSRVCNRGAAQGDSADVIVFLNNDASADDAGWLRQLVGWFDDSRVGAVGPRLEFPDGTIQHMGVVVGRDQHLGDDVPADFVPLAAHVGHGLLPDRIAGSVFDSQREVSALTAACIAVDALAFATVGGFDETLAIDFQDVDLCLRMATECGASLIYDPTVILEHEESASRGSTGASSDMTLRLMADRWSRVLADGDLFFSPHLALDLTLRPIRGIDHDESLRRISPRIVSGMSRGG